MVSGWVAVAPRCLPVPLPAVSRARREWLTTSGEWGEPRRVPPEERYGCQCSSSSSSARVESVNDSENY